MSFGIKSVGGSVSAGVSQSVSKEISVEEGFTRSLTVGCPKEKGQEDCLWTAFQRKLEITEVYEVFCKKTFSNGVKFICDGCKERVTVDKVDYSFDIDRLK